MAGIYHIATFFFLFQIGMGLANSMQIFPYYNMTVDQGFEREVVKYGESNTTYLTAGIDVAQAQTFGWGDYLFSMTKYVAIVYNSVAGIQVTLTRLGFDPPIPYYIQLIAWLSYSIAIISFIRGWSVKYI